MSTDDEKLIPFAEHLGVIPDERVAEMAGVSVEAVRAARGAGDEEDDLSGFIDDDDLDSDELLVASEPPPRRPAPTPLTLRVFLKRSTNVEVIDGRGHKTTITLAQSVYRGAMAARAMELVGDPSLFEILS